MKKLIILLILMVGLLEVTENVFASDFKVAFERTLKFEGSALVQNDVEVSKYGVTWQVIDVYNRKHGTHYSVFHLTKLQARNIYKELFWDRYKLYNITDQDVANNIFDWCVNAGGREAIKHVFNVLVGVFLQDKDRRPYIPNDFDTDIQLYGKEDFITDYQSDRLDTYQLKKNWERYENTWRNRIFAK